MFRPSRPDSIETPRKRGFFLAYESIRLFRPSRPDSIETSMASSRDELMETLFRPSRPDSIETFTETHLLPVLLPIVPAF